jgi:hypothetical protein
MYKNYRPNAHKQLFFGSSHFPQCLAWSWQTQNGLNDNVPVSNQILWYGHMHRQIGTLKQALKAGRFDNRLIQDSLGRTRPLSAVCHGRFEPMPGPRYLPAERRRTVVRDDSVLFDLSSGDILPVLIEPFLPVARG